MVEESTHLEEIMKTTGTVMAGKAVAIGTDNGHGQNSDCGPDLEAGKNSDPALFRPGSIHEVSCFSYWRDTLKASDWVLKTLQNGYSIPFTTLPECYEEPNNASAVAKLPVVRAIVDQMINDGIVKRVFKKPKCVSPLGLVSKVVADGSTKHRLVFDASRWLNLLIPEQKVTLSHLDKALQITEPGDWQAIFDLKSAFYQIRICEEQWDFLGAAVPSENGQMEYFVYKHLPFGLRCAVHAITKLWKPVIGYLQNHGVRLTIYIDDGRLLANSKTLLDVHLTRTYEAIQAASWQLEHSKSDGIGEGKQCANYLGFLINTGSMCVSADPYMLQSTIVLAQALLDRHMVPVIDLAKLMGKIVSLTPSHGYLARICTRTGYLVIAGHVDKYGWSGAVALPTDGRSEISFFCNSAISANGSLIQNALTSVRIESLAPRALSNTTSVPTLGPGGERHDGVRRIRV